MKMPYNNRSNYRNYQRNNGNGRQGNSRPQPTVATDFYNPFSFIPLIDKVAYLSEDEAKSLDFVQDVPFENGYSGKIKVDFESMTPFCVRSFNENNVNVDGRFVVPGSSIKGMIRSVLEIITLSNIKNGVANNRYSMRDIRSASYELKANDKPQKSGFLIKLNGEYFIHPCESEQILYSDIERDENVRGLKEKHSVKEKYKMLYSRVFAWNDGTYSMWFFSGFMNNKKHEFRFDIPEFLSSRLIPLKGTYLDDFKFIYEYENENESWKFWKKQLKDYSNLSDVSADGFMGIVPCFFRTVADGSQVKDLGFSYLYRQPYKKKIHDFLPNALRSNGIDIAQAIFGYVNGNKAVKGRIQFGNSFIAEAKTLSKKTFILGSPKPTYYPFYLEQNQLNNGQLHTYFSNSTVISGYKRYLVQNTVSNDSVLNDNKNVQTCFVPLDANTKFSSYIYFHNLKDYELGALLAAITFCGNQTSCCHSLGYAKPYGFGKIRVNDIKLEQCSSVIDEQSLQNIFIQKVCQLADIQQSEWQSYISKLLVIARGNYQPHKIVRYPDMQKKEFAAIKNKSLSLKDFSIIK